MQNNEKSDQLSLDPDLISFFNANKTYILKLLKKSAYKKKCPVNPDHLTALLSIDPHSHVTRRDLSEAYRKRFKQHPSNQALFKSVRATFPNIIETRPGKMGQQERCFIGITLNK